MTSGTWDRKTNLQKITLRDVKKQVSGLGYQPHVHRLILRAVRGGVPMAAVARTLGVTKATVGNWIASQPGLQRRVNSLRLKRLVGAAEDVKRAGEQGDWRASAWFLEKACRPEFGPQPDVTAINVDLSPEDRRERLRKILVRISDPTGSGEQMSAPRRNSNDSPELIEPQ